MKKTSTRTDGASHARSKGNDKVVANAPINNDFPRGGGSSLTPFEHRQALRELSVESKAKSYKRSENPGDLFDDHTTRSLSNNHEKSYKHSTRAEAHMGKRVHRDQVNATKRRRVTPQRKEGQKNDARSAAVLFRDTLAIGTRVLCVVSGIKPNALTVTLPDNLTGHVPITNVSDKLTELLESSSHDTTSLGVDAPLLDEHFSLGQHVVALVVAIHTVNGRRQKRQSETQRIELSLNPALVNDGVRVEDLCRNFSLPMSVTNVEDNGYLVSAGLDRITGFIAFNEAPRLRTGQVVRGTVLTVSESKRAFTASLQSKSLRDSTIPEAPRSTALLPGLNVKALIMDKLENGLQLKLFGLFDATVSIGYTDPGKEYAVGHRVHARILWDESQAYETRDNRIAMSLQELPTNATGHLASLPTAEASKKLGATSSMIEEKPSRASGDIRATLQTDVTEAEGNAELMQAPLLEYGGTMSWYAEKPNELAKRSKSDAHESSIKKEPVRQTQDDLTLAVSEKAPTSASEFEKLLLSSPNSSFLWIQFVSFYVQLGDLVKARQTIGRALQSINYREEEEKLNIWVALLNLENSFGDERSLEAAFKEACAFNDHLHICLKFAKILENANKTTEAIAHWKRTAKRFGHSVEVWTAFHRYLVRTGGRDDGDTAASVVGRSLQSLDKSQHINAISAFAINEFRFGDVESGRTMLEGLVDSYPKRLDIWLQYVDQEIRLKMKSQVRNLFERMLVTKLSSKKVRSILRKWLEYEKEFGSNDDERYILELARKYVDNVE